MPEVFVVFNAYPDRLGKLKDVGKGGAGFEYAVIDNSVKDAKRLEVEVDIFGPASSHFVLSSVPCKVVYDIRIERPTVIGIETRRCGLRFDKLSYQHSESLKLLLDYYVSHCLPDESVPGES